MPSCLCRTGRSRRPWRTVTTSSRWRTPRGVSTRSRHGDRVVRAQAGVAEVTGLQGGAAQGRAAAAVQHHGAHERGIRRRRLAGACHARRRVPLPRRPHQLPAHRQHRLPAVARPARQPRGSGRLDAGRRHAARLAGRASTRRRGARSATPTTRRSTRSACPERRARAATRPKSTTSSCAASWRRCFRRRSSRASAWTSASVTSRSWRAAAAWPRPASSRSTRSTPPSAIVRCPSLQPGDVLAGTRAAQREQGDPAPVALRAGSAHRADGGPRPGHQGHPRRHHPAPVRPQLRARQPRRAHRARGRAHHGVRRRHEARARRHLVERR